MQTYPLLQPSQVSHFTVFRRRIQAVSSPGLGIGRSRMRRPIRTALQGWYAILELRLARAPGNRAPVRRRHWDYAGSAAARRRFIGLIQRVRARSKPAAPGVCGKAIFLILRYLGYKKTFSGNGHVRIRERAARTPSAGRAARLSDQGGRAAALPCCAADGHGVQPN